MKVLIARFSLALLLLAPFAAWSMVAVSITLAPPALPEYAQPLVPGDGYIWMPGYWGWNAPEGDYFWVPGTWVLAPGVGELWTPGYWGYENSGYLWHGGYWGSSVGFYGGLNYGYGYTGSGYQGGRWSQGVFQYNQAASNVNRNVVHAIYNARVISPASTSRVSYNGGAAGSRARPSGNRQQVAPTAHGGPTAEQSAHEQKALTTPTQRVSLSHGAPPVAATPRPSAFTDASVEPARAKVAARAQPTVAAQRAPVASRASAPRVEPEMRSAPSPHPEHQAAQQAAPQAAQHAPQAQHAEREPARGETPHPER